MLGPGIRMTLIFSLIPEFTMRPAGDVYVRSQLEWSVTGSRFWRPVHFLAQVGARSLLVSALTRVGHFNDGCAVTGSSDETFSTP